MLPPVVWFCIVSAHWCVATGCDRFVRACFVGYGICQYAIYFNMPTLLQSLFLDSSLFQQPHAHTQRDTFNVTAQVILPFTETHRPTYIVSTQAMCASWSILKLAVFKGHIHCVQCVIEYIQQLVTTDVAAYEQACGLSPRSRTFEDNSWIADYAAFVRAAERGRVKYEGLSVGWLVEEVCECLQLAIACKQDDIADMMLKYLLMISREVRVNEIHLFDELVHFDCYTRLFDDQGSVKELAIVCCHYNLPIALGGLLGLLAPSSTSLSSSSSKDNQTITMLQRCRLSNIYNEDKFREMSTQELLRYLFADVCARGYTECGIIIYRRMQAHNREDSNDTIWTPPGICLHQMPVQAFWKVCVAVISSGIRVNASNVEAAAAEATSTSLYAVGTPQDLLPLPAYPWDVQRDQSSIPSGFQRFSSEQPHQLEQKENVIAQSNLPSLPVSFHQYSDLTTFSSLPRTAAQASTHLPTSVNPYLAKFDAEFAAGPTIACGDPSSDIPSTAKASGSRMRVLKSGKSGKSIVLLSSGKLLGSSKK
jgi:hypothetical protein